MWTKINLLSFMLTVMGASSALTNNVVKNYWEVLLRSKSTQRRLTKDESMFAPEISAWFLRSLQEDLPESDPTISSYVSFDDDQDDENKVVKPAFYPSPADNFQNVKPGYYHLTRSSVSVDRNQEYENMADEPAYYPPMTASESSMTVDDDQEDDMLADEPGYYRSIPSSVAAHNHQEDDSQAASPLTHMAIMENMERSSKAMNNPVNDDILHDTNLETLAEMLGEMTQKVDKPSIMWLIRQMSPAMKDLANDCQSDIRAYCCPILQQAHARVNEKQMNFPHIRVARVAVECLQMYQTQVSDICQYTILNLFQNRPVPQDRAISQGWYDKEGPTSVSTPTTISHPLPPPSVTDAFTTMVWKTRNLTSNKNPV